MNVLPVMALGFGLCLLAPAEEETGALTPPSPPPPAQRVSRVPRAPRAWLGLDLIKPDASITAQLPSLPPGIGFVVRAVEKDGPGHGAGFTEFDVIWKFNDQLLVNESQLAALLRISKPGDEVTFSGFRAGKPLALTLKLGEAPANVNPFPPEMLESAVFPGVLCGGPMREVNIGSKTATYTNQDGRAEVRKPGEAYLVKITNPGGEVIFDGELKTDEDNAKIPNAWKHRVHALRRGLDLALEGGTMPSRQPRPRVIAPAMK